MIISETTATRAVVALRAMAARTAACQYIQQRISPVYDNIKQLRLVVRRSLSRLAASCLD